MIGKGLTSKLTCPVIGLVLHNNQTLFISEDEREDELHICVFHTRSQICHNMQKGSFRYQQIVKTQISVNSYGLARAFILWLEIPQVSFIVCLKQQNL